LQKWVKRMIGFLFAFNPREELNESSLSALLVK
jgi:hypothetical protein